VWVINFETKFWDLLSQVGYDHPCMSFVYSCVLFLVVFLALRIFVVVGVASVYMCVFFRLLGDIVFWICVLVLIYLCLV